MRWRFALRLKWIVRHVLVVILCSVMIMASFWQWQRLDDKRHYRDLVQARQAAPRQDIVTVVPDETAVAGALYRSVDATGTYAASDTFVVENRSLNGASGAWVLTPLLLDDGDAVVVNRGFVGFDREGEIVPPTPPAGRVRVEGLVYPSQERGRFGPKDPPEGTLSVLARVDLDRLARQVDYRVVPAYVQLVSSDPPEPIGDPTMPVLVALGTPEPDLGPHLAYAVQWGIFTIIAGGGYLLLLRRVAEEEGKELD